MNVRRVLLTMAALVSLLAANAALYTLDETEQAIITQFGQPVGRPVRDAGLHVKLPFIQKVTFFDKRILEWDGAPNQIPTEDKKYIWVNTFARWRIVDPLKFYQSVNNETAAQSRLDDIIDGVTRDIITQSPLIEVVRNSNREMTTIVEGDSGTIGPVVESQEIETINSGRSKIMDRILAKVSEMVPQYGIEVIDVRIKHINYIDDVLRKVYDRMIAERNRIAEKYRSEGQGERAKIEGQREKDLQTITSQAYKQAQQIKGEADARAARIYAEAYNRDPEFYSFLQTLESYRTTLNQNSTLFLKTDADFLKYLKSTAPR
ncbi:MAG: protease modulator HflC [candidate division KSB1 bacterium]|nr:protease modulator HflC [candidate division KSB1 bacterium]MDZ7275408.1 protease modulator HflC [candidate division KSB1 bacterium]MDZ7286280.1 protease modulator HflC [candidate division KSB1 bacterium]MDZ7296506.1 protease modulator HflC [candidate division KSB1 bacterium]MDZ7305536.1 protease modulator HflC [candidate division KSB1 bacterium]